MKLVEGTHYSRRLGKLSLHIISGLEKRCLGPAIVSAAATGEAKPAAKKLTAKEIRERGRNAFRRAGSRGNRVRR